MSVGELAPSPVCCGKAIKRGLEFVSESVNINSYESMDNPCGYSLGPMSTVFGDYRCS